jgi:2-methylcitrate dehydratase
MGFWQQVSGPFAIERLGGPTEADWMLPKTSIKFVPAEYHSQSAIAAAFELRKAIGDPRRITSIEIATFRTAVEIIGQDPEKWRPKTRETADHSLPYCTAVALVDGQVTADQFSDERLADPALLDLVARTTVVEDPELTAGYPAGIPNRVKVTLNDGSVQMLEMAFPPGHDKNPLTDEQLHEKFRGLAAPILGADRVATCLERISEIETLQRPHELIRLLDLPA